MSNTTYRVLVEKLGASNPEEFVGNEGEVFYDPTGNVLRLSDGTTPGGVVLGGGGGVSDRIINFNDDEGDLIGIRRSLLPSGQLSFIRLHDSRLLSWYSTSSAALVYDISSGNLYLNSNGRRPGFGAGGGLIAQLGPTDLGIDSIAVVS